MKKQSEEQRIGKSYLYNRGGREIKRGGGVGGARSTRGLTGGERAPPKSYRKRGVWRE